MSNSTSVLSGAVLTTGIPGTTLDGDTREALERIQPSGIILFRRNVESIEQLRSLVADLHQLPSRPLVSIDHEGGRVVRVGEPFTHFPPARQVGDARTAHAVGLAMARELASVGIDIDFAPVLDVDSNPANPIIGDRAFSSDPKQVSELAAAFAEGMREGGVLTCGKHFPGHGDTDRDSHLELPVVRKSREELEATELVPFRATAAEMPMLMTAHVLYPALDRDRPATLSPTILGDLLRNDIGYQGVIVSDDLEMRALSDNATVGDSAVASLRAGCDWLLICNDFSNTLEAARRLDGAIASGELSNTALRASERRIRNLSRPQPQTVALPCSGHRELADRIASLPV